VDQSVIATIRQSLEIKATDELRKIHDAHDASAWSPEAFEAMRQILTERGAEVGSGLRPGRAAPAANRSVAVTVIGLLTLLLAGAHAALGGWFLYLALGPAGRDAASLPFVGSFLLILAVLGGITNLGMAVVTGTAGVGVLLRREWGRILALVLAGMTAIQAPALVVVPLKDSGPGKFPAAMLFPAAIPFLCAALAFLILIKKRAEFSPPQLKTNQLLPGGNEGATKWTPSGPESMGGENRDTGIRQ
jgi:hypothetical protein